MGFGTCCVGFLLLITDSVGLDFLGYALMASGFFGVSAELKAYRGYRAAALAASAAAPAALLGFYSFLTRLTSFPKLPDSVMAAKSIYLLLALAVICAGCCAETARIAAGGGARFFAFRARATMCVSLLYCLGSAAALTFGASGGVSALLLILRFLVPILNALLLFTCFTTITTKRRAAEEEAQIKEEMQILERRRFKKHTASKDTEDKASADTRKDGHKKQGG